MALIKAKKQFGQNFLTNDAIKEKIVEVSQVDNEDVIEIGPGLGAITFILAKKVKSLTAFEIDRDLHQKLSDNLKQDNVEILLQDFLEFDFNQIKDKVKIVANIPYYITSDILFKLLRNYKKIKSATLMVQKEVSERLDAKPRTKEYSKLTVSVNYVCKVKKQFDVKKTNFNPIPKVDSAVITLEFKDSLPYDLEKFLHFVKLLFQFKRKTLFNNLIHTYNKEDILNALEKIEALPNVRSEELSLEQIENLFKELN
ncbi:16S rRNA (adenine1518-N6/adenine1519-N6)-dimethyltransferase [Metamycoplasma subdolum]|uniref:Ribosomal RNA small subunit methyltransferase A n=1 Tax=Metamycoplasma subdolum TaxID=92407 RepID=A0A3M0A870_9BACT|nr:16S rRNA (adenine(1518)-N(6)/adenine(1519)-N(6))-dimethyltransferase RsmA [Metamycoplasma subdolum]RMA79018.1 16S rRNA (adenine1518-N6/adenine1519-N6)-dimethyltransferase [Metamycoplasma subdolum]WPB50541.1 16S rRNA (adenine(1518)-N(6)/adenine(1519)-N(6))-dimethyltransferase RsmA [Metamycoplasma subdolum]